MIKVETTTFENGIVTSIEEEEVEKMIDSEFFAVRKCYSSFDYISVQFQAISSSLEISIKVPSALTD